MPIKRLGGCSGLNQEKLNGIDLLLVVGNDKTLLKVAALTARKNIPILGVNAKQLYHSGDLMALGWHEAENLSAYLEGELHINNHPLLRVSLEGSNECEDALIAEVTPGGSPKVEITLHMRREIFGPFNIGLLSVETALSYVFSQCESLDNQPYWDYKYTYVEIGKPPCDIRIEASDFKLKMVDSSDNRQAILMIDSCPSSLKWNKTGTIEFWPSPFIVKLLRRKTRQQ